jgi:hypothetical protein
LGECVLIGQTPQVELDSVTVDTPKTFLKLLSPMTLSFHDCTQYAETQFTYSGEWTRVTKGKVLAMQLVLAGEPDTYLVIFLDLSLSSYATAQSSFPPTY